MGEPARTTTWEVRKTESACTAVKRVIASLEECAPGNLGILGNVVEPEALDNVVDPAPGPTCEPEAVSFRYCGYDVLVGPDRAIHVRE